MDIDNIFDLLVAILFYMSPKLVVIETKAQDLVI